MTIDGKIVTSMAEKYRLAEKLVFAKLAKWQQDAIREDQKTGHESSLLNQYAKDVIRMAEQMEIAPPPAKPPVAKKPAKPVPQTQFSGEVPPWHDKNGANGNESDEESLI